MSFVQALDGEAQKIEILQRAFVKVFSFIQVPITNPFFSFCRGLDVGALYYIGLYSPHL